MMTNTQAKCILLQKVSAAAAAAADDDDDELAVCWAFTDLLPLRLSQIFTLLLIMLVWHCAELAC